MRIAYLDCFSGISGDMLLGALLDAGASRDGIERGLRLLKLPPWRWKVSRVRRGAFLATRVEVAPREPVRPRAGLIRAVRLRAGRLAGLPPQVRLGGERILRSILAAEGKVHGVRAGSAHLHEIEDLDTIIDVYGSLLALDSLGVDKIYSSALNTGSGTVRSRHGELPVPAPGTAELLRDIQVRLGGAGGELVTPTGAALVANLAEPGLPPAMILERTGHGAGGRDTGTKPNLVRVMLGRVESGQEREGICQVECVVDDMSPQLVEAFLERIYREGALEAWSGMVHMKRQRPAIALTALAREEALEDVIAAFLEETGTLGVRITRPERVVLPRRVIRIRTRFGTVRVKLAGEGRAYHAVPEYVDIRSAARRARVPTRLVLAEIQRKLPRFPPKPPRS